MFNALIALINRDEEGQGLAEYALILALIAIVAIVALIFLGNQVSHDPFDGRRLDLTRSTARQAKRRLPIRRPAHCYRGWTLRVELDRREVISSMIVLAIKALIQRFTDRDDDNGQGLAEYALILALIASRRHRRPVLPRKPGQRQAQRHRRHDRLGGTLKGRTTPTTATQRRPAGRAGGSFHVRRPSGSSWAHRCTPSPGVVRARCRRAEIDVHILATDLTMCGGSHHFLPMVLGLLAGIRPKHRC